MSDEFENLIKPIRNASAPGTLAALSLAALKIGDFPRELRFGLLLGAIMFLSSAFFIFFFSIYPTKRSLWTSAAVAFLLGLFCLIISALAMLLII
jgi:uncharacterized membrane protein YwaF